MDWINRLELIKSKLKGQLHARGVDNILQSQHVFAVGSLIIRPLGIRLGQIWRSRQARVREYALKARCFLEDTRTYNCLQLV